MAPGETVSLLFSIPPELAAAVDADSGEVSFPGPARHAIRIGGAASVAGRTAPAGMNELEGRLEVLLAPRYAAAAAAGGAGVGARLVVQPAPPRRA